ncbi:MAG: hypothetical protein JWO05_2787 [Gemmatimonadetes bacterium]|nr:hypothetical protein [Gemmatimonadota bacterium]
MPRIAASWILIAPALLLGASRPSAAPEKVQLVIGTLHAAALTTSRAAGDSSDAPFFVVSVVGAHASASSVLPASGQLRIHENEALGARPVTELSLASGDSVTVVISVLEDDKASVSDDARVAAKSAGAGRATVSGASEMTRLVSPLVKQGAHWIGSATLLITNEGGATYWRRLDCLESCSVLTGPSAAALPLAKGVIGVVELSGNGGTYHMQLQATRG